MVTIADLKPIETARKAILKALMKQPFEEVDLLYAANENRFPKGAARESMRDNLYELTRLGLIERWDNHRKNDTWYWLTEAGWHLLGYEEPEYYGDPRCEECDGSGRVASWEDDDKYDVCDMCEGVGADPCDWFELVPIEELD